MLYVQLTFVHFTVCIYNSNLKTITAGNSYGYILVTNLLTTEDTLYKFFKYPNTRNKVA